MAIEVKVLGGGGEVGRLSLMVRKSGEKEALILDAGVSFDEEDRPIFASTYPPKYVRAIILSHAHLDHIGSAPLYYISGRPQLYATKPTLEMTRLMLEDFLKLNGYYSPYEHEEVNRMLESARIVDYDYDGDVRVGDFSIRFYGAGHIPGSVMSVLEVDGLRIAFTGDINTIETKLMKPADLDRIGEVDVLITEATYGDATHPPRKSAEDRLVSIIEETVDRGGTVLIPAFSIARGQEIMMVLAERSLGYNVAVDGMIRQVSEIFLNNKRYINRPELLEKASREFLFVRGWQDRHHVWKEPGVLIASAGMLKGGPSLYYLKRIGSNPRNAVVLVSFQAPGTPGRRILEEGLMPGSEEPVRARLEWIDFSSHADKKGLLKVIEKLSPRKVIVVHSELETATVFAETVREYGVEEVIVPRNEEVIQL
ncbi:MAG: MBL fold metallo-hydrolase [Pyrodictiaceae archaeon]